MNYLIENWYIGVALIGLLFVLGLVIFKFVKLPSSNQMTKVREWLIFATIEAEKSLGTGVGALKLRVVYDMFLTRFKWMSVFITFEMFSSLVDEALVTVRDILKENKAVRALIEGESKTEK